MGDNFYFIMDVIDYKGNLPLEIIPGHWFRKANTEEIRFIKKQLRNLDPKGILSFRYENKFVAVGEAGSSFESVRLPRKEWKYYLISFSGFNDKAENIKYAANLLKNDITIGFDCIKFNEMNSFSTGYSPFILPVFIADNSIWKPKEISLEDTELFEVTTTYDMISKLDKRRYSNVIRALSDFTDTKMITNRSPLKSLSYFGIIEALLTHDPERRDLTDSLTRQVSTKMSLLTKNFQREVDYTFYFPELKEKTKVWKKLYAYRSTIAHGGQPNFSGEFKALVSPDRIRKFLKESVKLLILYSLKEPEFVADLQQC